MKSVLGSLSRSPRKRTHCRQKKWNSSLIMTEMNTIIEVHDRTSPEKVYQFQ